jgi:hypothetical protein
MDCLVFFNVTPSVGLSHQNKCRTGIMKTYWCSKKNSRINWINNREDSNPAVTPSLQAERSLGGEWGIYHHSQSRKINSGL